MENNPTTKSYPPRTFTGLGLQAKMVVTLALFLSLLMFLVSIMQIKRERENIFKQMRKDGIALARGYALGIENSLLLEKAGLSRITGEAGRTEGIEFMRIVDAKEMVIGHTDFTMIGEKFADTIYAKALSTAITALEKGKTPVTRMLENRLGQDVFCVILPLVTLGEVKGVLEIGLETSGIKNAIEQTGRQSKLIAFFVLAFGVIFIWLFARSLVNPLRHLAAAAGRIAAGDLNQSIKVQSRDEIGFLASSFGYMTEKLRENMNALQTTNDALQKNITAVGNMRTYIENILNSIAIGIITVDLTSRITYLNNTGKSILGIGGSENTGKMVDEIFPAGHFLNGTFRETARSDNDSKTGKMRIKDVIADSKVLCLHTDLLYDQNARIVGYLAVFEDVTELRQLHKRVQHDEKMGLMGRLAAGIAHEVRNPLGAMKTCAQQLKRSTDFSDQRYHFIELILRESKRVESLVSRLLNYARPDESDVQYHDVNIVIDNAVELASIRAHQLHVTIERHFGKDLPKIFIDEKRISQAVLNLLLNSLDFINDKGTITVATFFDHEAEKVRLVIADTGIGIPKEQKDRIFDPFFTTRQGGTGLGLSIVQQIVFEHNGTIEVESREGVGTEFTITLPVRLEQGKRLQGQLLT